MTVRGLMQWNDHILGHNMIGRGDQSRKILIADLGIRECEELNATKSETIMYVMARDGKENKEGRFDVSII